MSSQQRNTPVADAPAAVRQRQSTPLRATVLITSRNRCDLLLSAVRSAMEQTEPVEILVVDDGSDDGTAARIRSAFPEARVVRNEQPLGIIAARNEAAKLVRTPILFTLDDDAVFSTPDVVAQTLRAFDHPRVGAAAIPLVDFIEGERIERDRFERASDADFSCVFAYRGGANAKRVDLFLRLGGYGGVGRQGEESSYCIRMLDAGYVVRAAAADPVHHYPHKQNERQADTLAHAAQNAIVFAWQHAPWSRLPAHWAGATLNFLRHGVRRRCLGAVVRGLGRGYGIAWSGSAPRRGVRARTYRLARRLIRTGPIRYSAIAPSIAHPVAPTCAASGHSVGHAPPLTMKGSGS